MRLRPTAQAATTAQRLVGIFKAANIVSLPAMHRHAHRLQGVDRLGNVSFGLSPVSWIAFQAIIIPPVFECSIKGSCISASQFNRPGSDRAFVWCGAVIHHGKAVRYQRRQH